MSNNKENSVEYLWEQLKHWLPERYTVDDSVKILSILQQAKAMHESEIQQAFDEGNPNGFLLKTGEQYYNETFGDNNEQQ